MKSLEELKTHFRVAVAPALGELEERRGNVREGQYTLGFGFILLIFVVIADQYLGDVYVRDFGVPWWLSSAVLFSYCVFAILYYRSKFLDDEVEQDFKELAVKELVTFMDESLEYDAKSFLPYEEFRESKLFMDAPEHYSGDDLIEGTVDGIPIKMSELKIMGKDKHSAKKNPRWFKMFHGMFMIAEYPEELPCDLFIFPSLYQKRFGFAGRAMQKHHFFYGHNIQSFDLDFNDHFAVYASDHLVGESLLTDELINRINRIRRSVTPHVYMSLIGNKIFVGLNVGRDIFKLNANDALLSKNNLERLYKDFHQVMFLIEGLNIDELILPTQDEEEKEEAGD